jgi:xanthine dehydrogenase/oxidase
MPTLLLAAQDAVYTARADAGLGSGYFRMDSPATPERLRMATADHLTAPFADAGLLIRTSC